MGDLQTIYGQHLTENDPSTEEMAAFAHGAGIDLDALLPELLDLLVLARVDLVRWAIDRRPDRREEVACESRAFLQGFLAGSARRT
jgi:hypothetical protein